MEIKPILFNGEMVRAILEGRKTQTRRMIKPQPFSGDVAGWRSKRWIDCPPAMLANALVEYAPLGQPGGQLWVRETFIDLQKTPVMGAGAEKYDGLEVWYRADSSPDMEISGRYTPSIHMPRWASRITLEITNVSVERAQEITQPQIIAEGITIPDDAKLIDGNHYSWVRCHREAYRNLWNSIYNNWDENPWVWVYEFKVIGNES